MERADRRPTACARLPSLFSSQSEVISKPILNAAFQKQDYSNDFNPFISLLKESRRLTRCLKSTFKQKVHSGLYFCPLTPDKSSILAAFSILRTEFPDKKTSEV